MLIGKKLSVLTCFVCVVVWRNLQLVPFRQPLFVLKNLHVVLLSFVDLLLFVLLSVL